MSKLSRAEVMRQTSDLFKRRAGEVSPERCALGLPAIAFGPPGPVRVAGPVDRATGTLQPFYMPLADFESVHAPSLMVLHLLDDFQRAQKKNPAMSEPEARFDFEVDELGIETAARIAWVATMAEPAK